MKVLNWTLTSAFIRAIYWTVEYIQSRNIVAKSLYGDAFKRILKSYLKMDAKIDWLGRVWGVVNPSINNGKIDFNSMVIEMDGFNTNNNTWVENWLYKQMILVENVFGLENTGFFDYITVDTSHVGPSNFDNYLVIFDIAARKTMASRWKRVLWQSLLYAVIGILFYYIIL